MAKYQYTVEDSHTFIKPSENEQKVKVVTGEIVEIDESYQNQARLFVAGFRKVKEDGTLDSTKSNDPKVEVEVKEDGKDEITIKVEKPSKKSK